MHNVMVLMVNLAFDCAVIIGEFALNTESTVLSNEQKNLAHSSANEHNAIQ